jgi:hypothetical protein
VSELPQLSEDELINVYDLLGRKIQTPKKGVLYLWQYKSGFVKKALAH